jgi:hypothetical protein
MVAPRGAGSAIGMMRAVTGNLACFIFAPRVVSRGFSPNSGVFSERYGFKTVFDST